MNKIESGLLISPTWLPLIGNITLPSLLTSLLIKRASEYRKYKKNKKSS